MSPLRRRLERVTRDLEGPTMTSREAGELVAGLAAAVRRHVTDPETLRAIAADMRRAAASIGDGRR